MIEEQKNNTVDNLQGMVIESTSMQYVETITLESDNNDYEHGFKIYYDDLWEPIYIRYWRLSLVPSTNKHYYNESVVSPDQCKALLAWRMGHTIITQHPVRERQVIFPKQERVMTEL